MKAILTGFGSSQLVSRDFPDCKEIGRTMNDILGKNLVQFGCVLSELMRNCYDSGESDEVRSFVGVNEVHSIVKVHLTPQSI